MIRFFCLGMILLSGEQCVFGQAPAPPATTPTSARVAVVGAAETADLVGLLTAELTNNPAIALVERSDLAKVGDEAKVQQLARGDALALGKLVGADGLMFLSKTTDGIHARLTSTGLGAVLFDLQLQPDLDTAELAKVLTNQIAPLVPKLKIAPEKVVLISVLNIRAEYGDAESVKLERKITLALESQLSLIPEFIILERRHAWAINFERTMNLSSDLLHGAYLIDGSIAIPPDKRSEITVSLRLRNPSQSQTSSISAKGSPDNPSQLAKDLAQQIFKAIGRNVSAPTGDSQAEAREYLTEGIWAWRNGLSEPALEALDSAELLGETASDLYAARIPVLCDLAADKPGIEPSFGDTHRRSNETVPIDPRLDNRFEKMLRAMDDTTRYKNEHGELKLEILDYRPAQPGQTAGKSDGRPDELTTLASRSATKILWMLDQLHDSRADELRQALRSFEGYDPLNHHLPGDWLSATLYVDDWSISPDEIIAYYQALASTRPSNPSEDDLYDEISRILLINGPKDFCLRFVQSPSEQRALFDKLIEKLISDPSTKTTGLLARATWASDADKQADYQAFLQDLFEKREQLVQTGDLGIYLTQAVRLQREITKPACPEFIALLHYDLQNLVSWPIGNYVNVWQPDLFPASDAPTLWKEYQDCKKRTVAYVTRHTGADGTGTYTDDPSKLNPMFTALENAYIQQFGQPDSNVAPTPTAPTSLPVTTMWHSWQVPGMADAELKLQKSAGGDGLALGNPDLPFHVLSYAMDVGDTLWILGYHDPYGSHLFGDSTVPATLFKVHVPDLQTEVIPLPWRLTPVEQDDTANIRLVPDGLYVFGIGKHLDYFKISTKAWQRREVTPKISDLFPVAGKLYFSFKGNPDGLGRYDWDGDQTIILANSRRRPAQNQFDDRLVYTVRDVFVTPEGKTYAQIEAGNYAIQEQPGTWAQGVKFDPFTGFPPDQNAGVFQSSISGLGNSSPPLFPPFSKEEIWLQTLPTSAMDYGFRGHEVFALVRDSGFKLLWYKPYDSTPFPILLDLKIDDDTRALMTSAYKFQFDGAISPASGDFRMIVSTQGICLFSTINSGIMTLPIFWFLPFTEIDAYLKAHAADKRPPVFNPLAGIPPEVLKNIQATTQAQHPNNAANTNAPSTEGGLH